MPDLISLVQHLPAHAGSSLALLLRVRRAHVTATAMTTAVLARRSRGAPALHNNAILLAAAHPLRDIGIQLLHEPLTHALPPPDPGLDLCLPRSLHLRELRAQQLVVRALARALKQRLAPLLLWRERIRLGDDVAQLGVHVLLCGREARPQLVADAAALQQLRERGLGGAQRNDAVDVGGGAAEQRGFEHAVRDRRGRRGLQLEQGEVDVPREVGGEPGEERARAGGLAGAVEVREGEEADREDGEVAEWEEQGEPLHAEWAA